ncbi:MAG: hypothetical protein QHH00_02155 [Methanomassiliicoccales archaeon]|nr:hypothetical protein [Methanomassiliicoccales archaeon]
MDTPQNSPHDAQDRAGKAEGIRDAPPHPHPDPELIGQHPHEFIRILKILMPGIPLLRATEVKSITEMPSMSLCNIVMPVSQMYRYKTYCKELINY